MPSCVVSGCGNSNNKTKGKEVMYFRFPRDPFYCNRWIDACQHENINLKTARMCSQHFTKEAYDDSYQLRKQYGYPLTGTRILKPDAIPTENLPLSEFMIESDDIVVDSQVDVTATETGPPPPSLESELEKMKDECNALQKERDILKKKLHICEASKSHLLNILNKYFTQGQVKLLISNKSKVHWSFEDISSAISLHSVSPKAYRYLKNVKKFPLPDFSTLRKWVTSLKVEPGVLNDVLAIMKHRTKELKESERLCVLSFDTAYISNEMTNNKDVEQMVDPRKTVQIAMAWGLFSNWKQIVYYNYDQKMTKDILFDIISELYKVNYIVVGVVSDLSSSTWSIWNELNIGIESEDSCYFQHPSNEKRRVYVFCDAQHLIKVLRDNLFDSGFVINDRIVDKQCFEKLVELQSGDVKLAPDLTKHHLEVSGPQRQKVKLALQCLSHTVAQAISWCAQQDIMGDLDCEPVVEITELISTWFDIFSIKNRFSAKNQTFGHDFESQIEVIDRTTVLMLQMRVGQNKGLLPFQEGIILTNNSLVKLFCDLQMKYNVEYLLPHRLNQEILANLFTYLRGAGALNDHPTPLSFKHCIRWYVLGKHSSPVFGENKLKKLKRTSAINVKRPRRKRQKILSKEL